MISQFCSRPDILFTAQVIAVVTDRLTDGPIIADLRGAASRGVSVYIILNQRSNPGNFTLNKLMHPVSSSFKSAHVGFLSPETL